MDRKHSDTGPPRRGYMGDGYGPGPRDRERERDGFGPGPDRMPRNFGRAPIGPIGMGMGGARPMNRALPSSEPEFTVDREKTCPLLLRVWTKNSGHHRAEDFPGRGKEPPGDIQVYTWMDATLKELSDLIKEIKPEARSRGSILSFAFIYPDKKGVNVLRRVGKVHSSFPGDDDRKTLKSLKFQTGDYLDVAVLSAGW